MNNLEQIDRLLLNNKPGEALKLMKEYRADPETPLSEVRLFLCIEKDIEKQIVEKSDYMNRVTAWFLTNLFARARRKEAS